MKSYEAKISISRNIPVGCGDALMIVDKPISIATAWYRIIDTPGPVVMMIVVSYNYILPCYSATTSEVVVLDCDAREFHPALYSTRVIPLRRAKSRPRLLLRRDSNNKELAITKQSFAWSWLLSLSTYHHSRTQKQAILFFLERRLNATTQDYRRSSENKITTS